jgi:hypothetical protein
LERPMCKSQGPTMDKGSGCWLCWGQGRGADESPPEPQDPGEHILLPSESSTRPPAVPTPVVSSKASGTTASQHWAVSGSTAAGRRGCVNTRGPGQQTRREPRPFHIGMVLSGG